MYHGDFQNGHYNRRSGLILGFHGTDESIVRRVVMQKEQLKPSSNEWDWIGHGVYFWEHSPSRALEFAQALSRGKNSKIKTPAVIGAVLELGNCFDLLDYANLSLLRHFYKELASREQLMPENTAVARGNTNELLRRNLDCYVIEQLHEGMKKTGTTSYDSVKAVFFKGPLLYPNAGFREKTPIQICVRNPNCSKGFFIPTVDY